MAAMEYSSDSRTVINVTGRHNNRIEYIDLAVIRLTESRLLVFTKSKPRSRNCLDRQSIRHPLPAIGKS